MRRSLFTPASTVIYDKNKRERAKVYFYEASHYRLGHEIKKV